eukprot:TRINITY_DN3010_c1_g1_i1.p1 TRINITY_DN3010_c1_g1~~TRINITY_DN3010_c1_g1_i1.p1  ORF type:complete len:843 (-),score=254.76 TRINITY_DN3010_c1_g1_i1:738-3266(-)
MSTDHNLTDKQVEEQLKDRKWQDAQIKGLSAWVNSYLNKAGIAPLKNVPGDFDDGVKLCQFLNLVQEDLKMEKYIQNPKQRIQKIENASKALKFIQNDLKIRLIGIGAEDIIDGDLKLTLGMLWSSFRKLALGTLAEGAEGGKGSKPEDDLLEWIRSMTKDYEGVDVQNFKNSFNDGLAWAALINRFDPDFLDFDSLDPSNPEATLNKVFDAAETKLGIPKLMDAKDLISGQTDERSVTLYSSLFYHAWKMDYSKRAELASRRKGVKEKVTELKSKLAFETEELEKAKAERENALRARSDKEQQIKDEMEAKIAELERKVAELRAERDRLKGLIGDGKSKRRQNAEDNYSRLNKDRDRLLAELEEERLKGDSIGRENVSLLAENKRMKEQLQKSGLGLHPGLEFGGSDLSLMRGLLREHANMLHTQWRGIQDAERDAAEKNVIRKERKELYTAIKQTEAETKAKTDVFEKNRHLEVKFKETGKTMVEILRVKDAINELCEFVDKKGYLNTQSEGGKKWKKRWFVLRGFFLSYYNKPEEVDDIAEGELSLENATAEGRELKSAPQYVIKFRVKENEEKEELMVASKNQLDRDEWLTEIVGRIVYLQYLNIMEAQSSRPDSRIVQLLKQQRLSNISLDNRSLSGGKVIKILKDFIEIHPELETVSFMNTELSDDEVVLLVENVLKFLPKLRNLNLSRNSISAKGLEVLGTLSNTGLQTLTLSHNKIGDTLPDAFLTLLKNNPEIRSLDLSHNEIADSGAERLSSVLLGLADLNGIFLTGNKIGDAGCKAIARVIESGKGIEEVRLKGNRVKDDGAKAVLKAVGKRGGIKVVDLGENEVGTEPTI